MTYEIFVDDSADFIEEEDGILKHYGILRRSGRYPWGSGGPEENTGPDSFLGYVAELRKQGIKDVDIAKAMGTTTTQLRQANSMAKNAQKQARIAEARRLKEKGLSPTAIGRKMKLNESSIRSLLETGAKEKADVLDNIVNFLRDQVHKKGFVDVGGGTELHIPIPGISDQKRKNAIARLREEGYELHYFKVQQLATRKDTTVQALAAPGTPYHPSNIDKVQQIRDFTEDGGRTFLGIMEPLSISSSRIGIRYKEDGGAKEDGIIFVRPGVKDVSIGDATYAQVRIKVDDTHYLKGMAIYKDDLPKGVDLVFNTPKSNTGNKLDVMKALKDDPENPFGATLRQIIEPDPKTGKKVLTSAMNMVGNQEKEGSGAEGSWDTWSRSLSSQILSKQEPKLAKEQLNLKHVDKKAEFDEIMKLTNPAVKKVLLEKFADDADSTAVHLKAAQMPRQANRVIIPVPTLKDNEVYAPSFRNGERVVLIRHPHGGIFEIPELTVNNKHPDARKLLGTDPELDAIGINHKVAEKLSGADFDGDTVLVIPNNQGRIRTMPSLERLKNFDPRSEYAPYDGMKTIDGGVWNDTIKEIEYPNGKPKGDPSQLQMGNISNLITDMTIKAAPPNEIAQAVRHSMVVIDAQKHGLDYKRSAIDHGIPALKKKYQGGARAGASTLISRKGQTVNVPQRKPGYKVDPVTGRKVYRESGKSYVDSRGNVVVLTDKVSKLGEATDAHSLVSDLNTKIERVYADHSNRMKELGNQARLAMIRTPSVEKSSSAAKAYADEVRSLEGKLRLAEQNRPLERQAQIIGNTFFKARKAANPGMDKEEEKRTRFQALAEARTRTGAHRQPVEITPSEWHAIQAGAISNDKLTRILKNADIDVVKQFATPTTKLLMTPTNVSRAKAYAASGYTQAEIADALGVSLTTLKNSLKS